MLKLSVSTVSVTVKLCEYVVPHLHETVTVTAHLTVRLAAAVLLTAVVVNLRARTTRTCAMLPEVVTLTGLWISVETCNTISRHPYFLGPDIKSLIILTVDGRIKPVLFKTEHLCQKLP